MPVDVVRAISFLLCYLSHLQIFNVSHTLAQFDILTQFGWEYGGGWEGGGPQWILEVGY